MKRTLRVTRAALVALAVGGAAAGAALATRASPATHAPPDIAGRAFAGDVGGRTVTIWFDPIVGGTVVGTCNTIGFGWRLEGQRLVAKGGESTLVYCGAAIARAENAFEHLLESRPRVTLDGTTLVIQKGSRTWSGHEVPTPVGG